MAAHIHLRAPGALLAPATPGSAMGAAGCTESVFALCIVFPFLSMAWARCALPYLHVPKVHSLGAECRPWQVSVVRSCSKQWMGLAAFQLLPGPCASRRHKQHRRREVNPHQHQRTRPPGPAATPSRPARPALCRFVRPGCAPTGHGPVTSPAALPKTPARVPCSKRRKTTLPRSCVYRRPPTTTPRAPNPAKSGDA